MLALGVNGGMPLKEKTNVKNRRESSKIDAKNSKIDVKNA